MNNYVYYGWVDHKNCSYAVHKYPIVEKQNITGIEAYLLDNYLVIDEHHSTRYIEEYYLDREIELSEDRVGLMSLDCDKALKWVKEKKLKRESHLLDELKKIKSTKIGQVVYI